MLETLRDIVEGAGYIPTIEGDRVVFRCEGTPTWFQTRPPYDFYTCLETRYLAPPGVDFERPLVIANDQNLEAKVVKTTVNRHEAGDFITFSIEMLAPDAALWKDVIARALNLLRIIGDTFFTEACSRDAQAS